MTFDISQLIEVEPLDKDSFLKVKETLTRIGIASRKPDEKKTLFQSCHVLHKAGKYYIVHFKQLFLLDGRTAKTKFLDEDLDRTEYIANLLEEWGLVKILTKFDTVADNIVLTVIPHKEKHDWNLVAKYTMGSKHK